MSRQRPLLLPALAFASGIWASEQHWLESLTLVISALAGLAAMAWAGSTFRAALALALFGSGGLAYRATQLPLDPTELRWQLAGQTVLGTIRGRLDESPSIRLSERRGEWTERTVVRLVAEAWKAPGRDWMPASGIVAVSSKGVPDSRFFRDQRVEITGALGPPAGPAAPGLLDYAEFLRRQGVGLQLLCVAPGDWALAPGSLGTPPWSERFLAWAQERLARGLPDDGATRLIWAMALGWKTALNGEVDDVFMRSGTMHVFAISGLHIALIASLLVHLLRIIRVPRAACGLIAAPLIWFYVAATGWQPSAIRSAVMTSVVVGTWCLRRPGDLLNSLAAAALIVLVWDPGQLFQAGFLLSFLVVGALPVLGPPLEAFLVAVRPWSPDPLLPESLWSPWRRGGEVVLRWLIAGLSTGLAALLASLPFTIEFFHLFSPVSLLANLVVVPLSGLVLVANACSLAVPAGTETWNSAAWLGMHGMMAFSNGCSRLPGAWLSAPSPPAFVWIPYAWLVFGVGAGWLSDEVRRRRWLVSTVVSGLACVGLMLVLDRAPGMVVFGSGEAVWIDLPGRARDLLVDVGDADGSPRTLIPSLRANGVNRLGTVAISHGDIRHAGGAGEVVEALRPRTLVLPAVRMRSAAFRGLDGIAARGGVGVRRLAEGDGLGGWAVVHPRAGDAFPRADDVSLTLMGSLAGWRVLLAPDLGRAGQEVLCSRQGQALASDVLITGVPRDGMPATDSLLRRVSPRLVIIGTGTRPATERTPRGQRVRLRHRGFAVLFTEDVGALTIRFGETLEVRNARGELLWSAQKASVPQGTETAR